MVYYVNMYLCNASLSMTIQDNDNDNSFGISIGINNYACGHCKSQDMFVYGYEYYLLKAALYVFSCV